MVLDLLKSIGEQTRLRMLTLLFYADERVCVGTVEYILKISGPNASRHLKRLLEDKLLVATKENQNVYYEINKDTFEKNKFLNLLIDKNFKDSVLCQEDVELFNYLKEQDVHFVKKLYQTFLVEQDIKK